MQQIQEKLKPRLLLYLADFCKDYYQKEHNPLGLVDDTIMAIRQSRRFPKDAFDVFYEHLAIIYRFHHGEVQLELLFDGSTHMDKYGQEWQEYFIKSVQSFCRNRFFLRAVLDIVVFNKNKRVPELAARRLQYFLTQYYAIKISRYRGVKLMTGS